MHKKPKTVFARIINVVKSIFLNGLIALLPLAITVGLITFIFSLVTSWLAPLNYYIYHYLGLSYPYVAIIVVILFIFFVGTILRIFLLRTIAHALENMISSLPIIRPVYNGVKQLVRALNFKDEQSFKNVVIVQFPRKGMYSVGFVTSELLRFSPGFTGNKRTLLQYLHPYYTKSNQWIFYYCGGK